MNDIEIEKQIAEKMALASEVYVGELMAILHDAEGQCDPATFTRIKRWVGLTIGPMEMNLFSPIYERFPELEPDEHRKARDET